MTRQLTIRYKYILIWKRLFEDYLNNKMDKQLNDNILDVDQAVVIDW